MLEAPLHSARVLRALTADHHIRFSVLDAGPLWDGVRRGHPSLDADVCAFLVESLSATLLLQARSFFSERMQLMVKGSGRAKAVVTDSWPEGDIRGMIDVADESSTGPWLAVGGTLRVMRSNPKGQPYVGTLALVEGELQQQIEAYLQQSEQVQASVTLWCDPATGEAGGCLVEPLPNCPPERLSRLIHAIEGLDVVPLWERDPEFLCRWINQGEGAEVLSATETHYRCRCQQETLIEILRGFEKTKLDELFQGDGPVEICCDYCGKTYLIRRTDLEGISNGPA